MLWLLDQIASWPSLICFSVAMLAEVAAYYIPWIDNALDLIGTPLALVGGALMMGGGLGDMPPYMRWSVVVIVAYWPIRIFCCREKRARFAPPYLRNLI